MQLCMGFNPYKPAPLSMLCLDRDMPSEAYIAITRQRLDLPRKQNSHYMTAGRVTPVLISSLNSVASRTSARGLFYAPAQWRHGLLYDRG